MVGEQGAAALASSEAPAASWWRRRPTRVSPALSPEPSVGTSDNPSAWVTRVVAGPTCQGGSLASGGTVAQESSVHDELRRLANDAIQLADQWARATEAGATRSEKATTGQLAALVADPAGLDLAVRFVDRVARPEDAHVAAKELAAMSASDASTFLGRLDRTLLGVGSLAARLAPPIVVPIARARLRQIVGHLVVDADDRSLGRHLAASHTAGRRLNINLLGEAVLGEGEAAHRTDRTLRLLQRPDVDYVSIKVSSLVSQIQTWDTAGTVARCVDRLRPLYLAALAHQPHAFVNLDMEEYRDLDVTLELFTTLLAEPELRHLEAGIVLQAYLPDALPALERLIDFASQRREAGGAPIKVRLVKGANLAMEQVEAELHGWTQAPYASKVEVDANYLRCVERALRPDAAAVMRVGIASHNLYDLALAHLLATGRGTQDAMDVEMLQGMSPAQARAVAATVGDVVLYTPVVAPKDFDVAVGYLVRRLEENATPENFLHAFASGSDVAMADQEARFLASLDMLDLISTGPARSPEPPVVTEEFENTPDLDAALPSHRALAADALASELPESTSRVLHLDDIDGVVTTARDAHRAWVARPVDERASVLVELARQLQSRRFDLITVMAHEGGKTVAEAAPEISEATDFARYYAESALDLARGLPADGARFVPDEVVLVTPPWNFPLAIPLGGVLAGLAAGAAVIIKPAHHTPRVVEVAAEALYAAGVPRELVQVVRTDEGATGRALVSHPGVDTVILTGASETAELFAGWRAGRERGHRVFGETSGKNALVITPSADLDLAVADLVKSAFGHAGQKCSAASLAILVGSVARSERFRKQLTDAVTSLVVGWPTDLGTTMGPIIEPSSGKLLRALTTLDGGESWLVEPRRLDDSGRLWSPGVKLGVRPGSFFHLTEVFGPVLGIMEARDLDQAIEWQNMTDFGLTGGLHSLDASEIDHWLENVAVGNAYVNRGITGAIVRRQPFGGWKASSVGPGAKAGGPNYVAQLGRWVPAGTPTIRVAATPAVQRLASGLLSRTPQPVDAEGRAWLKSAIESDEAAWASEFGHDHDPSALRVESNVFRYRPHPTVLVRASEDATPLALVRVLSAAARAGVEPIVSVASDELAAVAPGATVESAAELAARLQESDAELRVRVIGSTDGLDWTSPGIALLTGPVLATGRRELLVFLREQSVSRTLHRFGHLPAGR